ncbi:flagellar protein FlgN [Roseovarius sp. LXJ103]|uniref:flagellar protein FlgN n=1 Tax=Roseovarius carneus TaxID=2853164 RepID=UPI000D613597|nr:flagellar protein FlgN [Roseovarius carneus]MBZ8117527.1 flagellar protein FlgN [Roseovarius carneus]PWE36677.1 flagellar protein FlgN [Pelagicola sp. LXJ1103]
MTAETAQTLIESLDDLLEEERKSLLDGDLDAIGRLLSRKEALIDALNAPTLAGQPNLTHLQGKVIRNQALLDGALEGIRKVATRMAAFRKIRKTLETYDQSGRKTTIQGEVECKVERRA